MSASTTWEEYEHIAEFMHQPASGRYGAVVVGAPDDALWHHWTQYAYSFGRRSWMPARPTSTATSS